MDNLANTRVEAKRGPWKGRGIEIFADKNDKGEYRINIDDVLSFQNVYASEKDLRHWIS